jgi:CO/xanthine dehydrogenase FAD-binding subunit
MGEAVVDDRFETGAHGLHVVERPGAYQIVSSVEEALDLLERYSGAARVIAGGTDLMLDMRRKRWQPLCLVDISRVAEMGSIDVTDNCVTVGAAVTFERLRSHPVLKTRVRALTTAAASVGAWAIQSAATWAGNIVQGLPAADGAIVATALDAELRVVDTNGPRWMLVESTFAGPGVSTIDSSRQLVTHIRFALPDGRVGTGWQRLGRRDSLELPILNCAAKIVLTEDGVVREAAIAMGPVAPRPYRAREAEMFLVGKQLTEVVVRHAGEIVRHEANPRSSAARASREYRLRVIAPLVAATLAQAAADAGVILDRLSLPKCSQSLI